MQKFLKIQTRRRLQSHETIVEYMYSRNAILDKAPYRPAEDERISLILSRIEDDTWANPLAAQLCSSVMALIDKAALLDARRRMTVCADDAKMASPSTTCRGQGSNQRVPASCYATVPPERPRGELSGPPRPRSTSARSCFICGDVGHLSRDCTKPKTPATIRTDERRAKSNDRDLGRGTASPRQAKGFAATRDRSLTCAFSCYRSSKPAPCRLLVAARNQPINESYAQPPSHPARSEHPKGLWRIL
ncbi:hypothetical protein MTO96_021681 [Rhipicephalus appendiculatus]